MTLGSVLFVDDAFECWASELAALQAAGYTTDEARGGRRAQQKAAANPPEVLITKVCMAEGDGIELIGAVKRHYPHTRIIAVADAVFLGPLDLLDLAVKVGADATLAKPFDTDTLLATVASLARSRAEPA